MNSFSLIIACRHAGLWRLSLLVLIATLAPIASAADRPANFVLIVADDLGYADVGFNGCRDFATPNIDRIASSGVRFTNGYVSYSVCGPSRAGLMTGRYQDRFGFCDNPVIDPENPDAGLPLSETMISEALRPRGYRSAAIGKWHLGVHPTLHPLERGFDEFFGFLSGGHDYFPENLTLPDLSHVNEMWGWYRTKLLRNHDRVEIDDYLTDELSDAAIDFVQQNADQPFFLYLAYNAPHTPLQATQEYLARVSSIKDDRRRTYAAMVTSMDDGIGRLLDALTSSGMRQDTLVIFLSDNGGPKTNGSRNAPLSGQKGSLFEGGVRVPFAASWPGVLPEGVDYDPPVISLDILPTIAAQAGAAASLPKPLDGVDLLPYMTGQKPGQPHDQLFWRMHHKQMFATRCGNEKLVVQQSESAQDGQSPRLHDLSQDLGEKHNRAADRPGRVAHLREAIEQWAHDLKGPAFPGLGSWMRKQSNAQQQRGVDSNKE